MDFLQAIILGVVEGITEFLPISSTGHLILTSKLLAIPSTDFLKTFEIAIQLGAILAVIVLYLKLVVNNPKIILKVTAAFVPTAVLGYFLYPFVRSWLGSVEVVVWALSLGGIAIILYESHYQRQLWTTQEEISYRSAFLIGIIQSLALIPGVSRAAATILGALTLGIHRKAAVEFSFLLAVPTMLAATGFDLLKTGASFAAGEWQLLAVGFVAAFIAAVLAVQWLVRFIQSHTFSPFGWYRILIAVAFSFLVL